MARLTRTQKYADLRNQLENGREVEIQKENVSKLEDNQEELVTPKTEEVINSIAIDNNIKTTGVVEVSTDDQFQAIDLEEPSKTKEDDNFETLTIDDLMTTPSVKEEKDENFETLDLEDLMATPSSVTKEEPVIDHPIVIEDEPVTAKPIVEETIVEPIEVAPVEELVVEEPVKEEAPVEEEIHEKVAEVNVQPEIADITDNYLKECLNEVNEYNKSKGLMTDDDIPTTIINEIHGTVAPQADAKPETKVAEASSTEEIASELLKEDDFTNTVTLEIQKILSELEQIEDEGDQAAPAPVEEKLVQAQVEPVAEVEPETEETTQAEVEEILKSYLDEKDDNSDLAKTMTVGKVEEVPAASVEDSTTIQATLLSNQLPIDVVKDTQAVQAEEEDEEEEEEIEGPNRILNFILIALIIVLLFILGFIGYMILMAQGII